MLPYKLISSFREHVVDTVEFTGLTQGLSVARQRPALLFLCQRLPFPPNKGEKITSFNLVRHLGQQFDVHVGTFLDDPEDLAEIDRLRGYCASLHVEHITRPWSWGTAVFRWLGGLPLSFALYRAAGLDAYVRQVVDQCRPVAIVTHSSNISHYALTPTPNRTVRVLHFADVDSEKFLAYAQSTKGWKRWLYKIEAHRVRAAETELAAAVDAVAFVSDEETELFRTLVRPNTARVITIANGVDADWFDPAKSWPRPGWGDGPAFVFTGSMDYYPNIDAVVWFADNVLPPLREHHSEAQFVIVGSNPAPAVTALGNRPGVLVTGRVAEVQPYLAHAAAAIAPLRIARGIQNKVLEALAMGRPTIVTTEALTGIGTPDKTPLIVADGVEAWIKACANVIQNPISAATLAAGARAFVIEHFSWDARLRTLDDLLSSLQAAASRLNQARAD